MNKAERTEAARNEECPRCQAAPGRLCTRSHGWMHSTRTEPLEGIHAERLALIDADGKRKNDREGSEAADQD